MSDRGVVVALQSIAESLDKLVEMVAQEFDDSLVFETDGSAHKRSEYGSVGEQLQTLADAISDHTDRIIVEANGRQYEVTKVMAIGTKTEDPGLVIHLD